MAENTKRVAGTCYVKINGKQLEIAGEVTVSPANRERESKVGLSGVTGYIERPRVPYIEVECSADGATPLAELDGATDVTVSAELADGFTYVMRDAWSTTPAEKKASDGGYTVRFEGPSCKEFRT